MILTRKRKTDVWNEKAADFDDLAELKADQFADNVAHNKEGISADRLKFNFDETTTPKILPPNKRS